MVRLSQLRIDSAAVRDGRWFPWIRGARLRLGSALDERFTARLRELQATHEHATALLASPESEMAQAVARDLTRRAVADVLIHDWEGFEDDDGRPIPYSPEVGYRTLTDPGFEHLWNWISKVLADEEQFLAGAVARDEGKPGS